MKSTGIIRRLDDLGRIVIPKEIRRKVHLQEGVPMEIYYSENSVTFVKYDPSTSVKQTLDLLKEVIRDEPDLRCSEALLSKITECYQLLEDEDTRKVL